MELPLSLPGFEGQSLAVQTAGLWAGPRILMNGTPVKREKGFYPVTNNQGVVVPIKLKYNFLDPIPGVMIDQEAIQLARPLKWYEFVWMGLPILLIVSGGAIGAAIGIFAAHSSGMIFRSERGKLAKYGITALISVGAATMFLILATLLQIFVFKKHN